MVRGELMSSWERRLKVCWERQGRAAEAGVVEFQTQSTMTELGIWPTQREWAKSAPFILTFKTGSADGQGIRYTQVLKEKGLAKQFVKVFFFFGRGFSHALRQRAT